MMIFPVIGQNKLYSGSDFILVVKSLDMWHAGNISSNVN